MITMCANNISGTNIYHWVRDGVIGFSWVEKSLHTPHKIFKMTALSHFVHIAPAIEALETITLWGARVYALGSEIFTITAILWCLNFLGKQYKRLFSLVMHSASFIAVGYILI